jgi:hypothetical protein
VPDRDARVPRAQTRGLDFPLVRQYAPRVAALRLESEGRAHVRVAGRQTRPVPVARTVGGLGTSLAGAAVDCLFLGVVIAISVAPYVRGLGFYIDDFEVLGRLHASHDQSLLGLYHAVRPATAQRPLQAFLLAGLYRLFGWHPLGYHVVNVFLLAIVAALMYLVLRELRLRRLVCVAIPLVYSMLPNYATERFWPDTFQISLSTAFYLLSLYAGLRAARSSSWSAVVWVSVAVAGIAGSLLSYEIVFPLFAINLVLVWWAGQKQVGGHSKARTLAVVGSLAIATIVVGILKTALVAKYGSNGYAFGFYGGMHQVGKLVGGGIRVNLVTYLLASPYVVGWIFLHRFSAENAIVALAIGVLSFVYIFRIGLNDRATLPRNGTWRRLLKIGLVAFVLGYAIFLTTPDFLMRSAGVDNRINAAAALGIAAMLVGGLGWVAARMPRRGQLLAFSASIACIVVGGTFIIETLSTYWASAATQQHQIVSAIARDASRIPKAGVVILDGTCPEAGPAPIFATEWDLRNALRFDLRDPSLTADIASYGMHAQGRSLAIDIRTSYSAETRRYPLGRKLLIFDFRSRQLRHLRDRAEARKYLAVRAAPNCPAQRSFAWGSNPNNRWSLR